MATHETAKNEIKKFSKRLDYLREHIENADQFDPGYLRNQMIVMVHELEEMFDPLGSKAS